MNVTQDVQISNSMAMAGAEINALVREYADNKARADELTARNAEIADVLEKRAVFKPGSNTGHLTAGGYKVTVTCRSNIKWDREQLEAARQALGDAEFFKIFGWKYEPRSSKDLNAFLEYGAQELKNTVLKAMTTTPGKPAVRLEAVQ